MMTITPPITITPPSLYPPTIWISLRHDSDSRELSENTRFLLLFFLNQGRRSRELAVVMKRAKVRDHKVTCRSHGVWKIPHWCKSSKVVEQLLCNATEEQDAATTPTGQNGGWWMLGLGDEVRGVRWQDMMSFDRQEKVDGHAHTVLCWSVTICGGG